MKFKQKTFQLEDVARGAIRDTAIISWEQGLGKSIAMFTWAFLKRSPRTLVVAPTTLHTQLRKTAATFFGISMPVINTIEEAKEWQLDQYAPTPKEGKFGRFYITSYEALTRNGADEWGDNPDDKVSHLRTRRIKWFRQIYGTKANHNQAFEGIGETYDNVTCVWKPSLATMLGIWLEQGNGCNAVVMDEATRLQSSDSIMGNNLRKLDPQYRLLLTGTPIKNRLESIFWLLWWTAGGHAEANPIFPFAGTSAERERFANMHLEIDRFITQEEIKKSKNNRLPTKKKFYGKIEKRTARICNVHRLWKIIHPLIIRRRKEDCGEDIVMKTIKPITMPMGNSQRSVYLQHLENVPTGSKKSPTVPIKRRTALGMQLNNLRVAALDPHSKALAEVVSDGNPKSKRSWTIWTPKLASCLSLIVELLGEGEQVLIGSPFMSFSENLHNLLTEAGIPSIRLDSSVKATDRAELAERFKKKEFPVMIAGIKAMGEGISLECCSNLIQVSLSQALDENDQFLNRIWRINSPKPVTIYHLIALGSVDEKCHELYHEKSDSAQLALDSKITTERVEQVNEEQLLSATWECFRKCEADSIDEEELENEWPKLKRKLQIAWNFYNQFHPPVIGDDLSADDLVKATEGTSQSASDFYVAKERLAQQILRKLEQ